MNSLLLKRCRTFLKLEEGVRLKLYPDTKGKWTIGVGRNVSDTRFSKAEKEQLFGSPTFPDNQVLDQLRASGITKLQADTLLDNDIDQAYWDLKSVFGPLFDTFPMNRQVALLSMMFNLGRGRFLGFRNMIEAIRSGDWKKAAAEARDSDRARQLPDRSELEAEMMEMG